MQGLILAEPILASVIINNYNYAPFLRACIDSALGQSYPSLEVIVVDDGSTDDSRAIIAEYGDRVISVMKPNGGQASAFNAGFANSRGDVVVFLDSDDVLLATAVEHAMALFDTPEVVKVQWPLRVIDRNGQATGQIVPGEGAALPEGDLRQQVIRNGPSNHAWPPTSGNAWSRSFLDEVLPMPEQTYRLGADNYLFELAPLFGTIRTIREPQGRYRIHGHNNWHCMAFDEKLRHELEFLDQYIPLLAEYARRLGLHADQAQWKVKSWWYRLQRAVTELDQLVPAGTSFVLVDEGSWGMEADPRRRPVPFTERDGQYWGPPADDESAIQELERLRAAGSEYLVIAWPAFWWLEHYKGFTEYLYANFACVTHNDRLMVFRLTATIESQEPGSDRGAAGEAAQDSTASTQS